MTFNDFQVMAMLQSCCSAHGIMIHRAYRLLRISEPTRWSLWCRRVCNTMNWSSLLTRFLPRSYYYGSALMLCFLGGNPHLLYPGQLFLWTSLSGVLTTTTTHASVVNRSRRCSGSGGGRRSSPGVRVADGWQGWLARRCRDQRPSNRRRVPTVQQR